MGRKSRLRVLVVESDPRLRSLVADILGETAEVTEAADPSEAEERLAAAPRRAFDLVIVDCGVPPPVPWHEPHEVALIGRIHAQRPALPILAITGAHDVESVLVGAVCNGARDVVRKPFAIDDFRATVARLTLQTWHKTDTRARSRVGITRVMTFLAEHVGQRIPLDALARVAAMSRSHLSRSFRHDVGVPLRVYVRSLRLEHAQQLLTRSPQASLTEVALEAGFYDLPHLDKAFRERYGVSPSEFLRRKALAQASSPPRQTS